MQAYDAEYVPPNGYDLNNTLAVGLCKGTCLAEGVGPCWLRAEVDPWCNDVTAIVEDNDGLDTGAVVGIVAACVAMVGFFWFRCCQDAANAKAIKDLKRERQEAQGKPMLGTGYEGKSCCWDVLR